MERPPLGLMPGQATCFQHRRSAFKGFTLGWGEVGQVLIQSLLATQQRGMCRAAHSAQPRRIAVHDSASRGYWCAVGQLVTAYRATNRAIGIRIGDALSEVLRIVRGMRGRMRFLLMRLDLGYLPLN